MSEESEHTPDSVMLELEKCQTEVGKQLEAMRYEFEERHNALSQDLDGHQSVVSSMKSDWDQFIIDFKEMFTIFRSAKGFFRVLGWLGTAVKWITITGAAIAAIWIFFKTGHWPGVGE